MKAAAEAALMAAKLPEEKERKGTAAKDRARDKRLLKREVGDERERKLKKYVVGQDELWTWVQTGGMAQGNPVGQGLRLPIAGKRKGDGGRRNEGGADRTAEPASIQAMAKMRGIHF